MSGLRLVVLDDSPYVSWDGSTHAVNATFHRFLAVLLDLLDPDGTPAVARLALAAPVRPAAVAPMTLPVDPRIQIVGTVPFDGIAGYLRRAPFLVARNAPRLRTAIGAADVVLLRLPASNGILAALVARAQGVPRVAYVVGSVREVVAGQRRRGLGGRAARLAAAGYDGATRLAAAGAPTIVAGARLAGGGIVSSLVAPDEIRDRAADPWPAAPGELRLVYAGRLADGKGLGALLEAVAVLARSAAGAAVRLDLVGDGPAADALRRQAGTLGIADRVRFAGHVAARTPYLDALAAADVFVSASPAEGFPKAVLDAMAAGVPVVAVPAGRLAELARLAVAPILPVPPGEPAALADTVAALVATPGRGRDLRAAGRAFVLEHTAPAEAARLLDRLRDAADRRPR